MLPDHGRDIGWEEYSDLSPLALHCRKASETVAKWPAWKRGVLDASSKAQWDTPRFNTRGAETHRQPHAMCVGDPDKVLHGENCWNPPSIVFTIRDEAQSKMFREFFNKYMGRPHEGH